MKCPKCRAENPETGKFCSECGISLLPSEAAAPKSSASTEEKKGLPVSETTPDSTAAEKSPVAPTQTLKTSQRDLTIGHTFAGRYQVIEELGKGGMGRVYKVRDTRISEKIALKILNLDMADDEEMIQRFQNELKLARTISHRHVCRMYDFSEAEGIPYITMEYISGEDLKGLIRRAGHLSVGKAVTITRQAAEGLVEAHRLGVIHRDLKPQNIMVDREGSAKIMDFGIARSLAKKGITEAGVLMGTPEYMSPEQVDGKHVDQQTDIYALGIILYEMLTGKAPFEGDTPLSVALKQKTAIAPDPRKLNPQIHEDLIRVLYRCLEKDKKKRCPSAEELLADLKLIEEELPTTDVVRPKRRPLTSREITVKFSLKRIVKPGLALAALLILILILWRVLPRPKTAPLGQGKPSLAVMYFENNTGDEKYDHWRKALSDLLIADLSQSKYIAVLSGERLFNILDKINLLEAKSYSSEDLKEVAERGGVDNVFVGKLAMAGNTFRISTTIQKAKTGEHLGSEVVEGEGEERLFAMVDELTKRIKQNFNISSSAIAQDIDREAESITTASPEAYRYYSEGMKFFNKGDYAKSIPLLETAAALDSQFAMTLRSLASAYDSLGLGSTAKEKLKSAVDLIQRVSERERYHIQGDFFRSTEQDLEKARGAYKKLLELYPEDILGNTNLGEIYGLTGQFPQAIARFKAAIQTQSESIFPYTSLARTYNALGQYAKGIQVLEEYLTKFPDNAHIHFALAQNYILQQDFDLALEEANKGFSLDPTHSLNSLIRGDIHLYRGSLERAEKEYASLLETEEPKAHQEGFKRLGALYLLQGRITEAKNLAQQGLELAEMLEDAEMEAWFRIFSAYLSIGSGHLSQALEESQRGKTSAAQAKNWALERRALHLKGFILSEMERLKEASQEAESLKALVDKGAIAGDMRLYHHLQGLIAFRNNDVSGARADFQKALVLLPFQHSEEDAHALFEDSMASVYSAAKDWDEARKEYEKIGALTTGRLYYGDLYAKSFFELGRLDQQKGDRVKARNNYRRFLVLWKAADPSIPEITEARRQLTALED